MNWLGGSVRLRLIVLCIGLFVAFCLSSVLLVYLIDRMRDDQRAQSEQERRLATLAEVGTVLAQWRHLGGLMNEATLTHRDEEAKELRVSTDQAEKELRAKLARVAEFDSISVDVMTKAIDAVPELSDSAVKAWVEGRQAEAVPTMNEIKRLMGLVERTLDDAGRRERDRATEIQVNGERRSTLGLRGAISITLLTAVAGILLILTVLRSIIRPLKVTSAAIRQVNAGELAIDLPPIGSDEFGEMAQAVRHFRDRAEKLQRLAYQDSLTGFGNRAQLGEVLEAALDQCKATGRSVAVAFLDLDRFRVINERLGNKRADRYLCEVANRLSRFMPETGTLFRHGGNRFVILIDDLTPGESLLADLQAAADALMRAAAEPYPLGTEIVTSSVCMGIGVGPEDGQSSDLLIGSAEAALHTAKLSGRNKVRFAGAQQTASVRRRAALATDIIRGMEGREFELFYQPIVDYAQGRVVAAEGLVRWRHPSRGLLNAGEFIDVAEEEGLIVRIGEHCLRLAHTQAIVWERRGMEVRLAVNVSAQQLQDDSILQVLRDLQSGKEAAGSSIDLELTESTLFDHSDQTRAVLESIKSLGYRLGLDDFGTGYSSLSYIQRLPIDKIKIDRQFVATMESRPQALAVVTAILTIAHSLHLEVIAEGVETRAQADLLLQQGCALQQGFHFSRALPANEFEKWLALYEAKTAMLA